MNLCYILFVVLVVTGGGTSLEVAVEVSPDVECTHTLMVSMPQLSLMESTSHVRVRVGTEDRTFDALVADALLNSYIEAFVVKRAPEGALSAKIIYTAEFESGVMGGVYPSLMTWHPATGMASRIIAEVTYEGPDVSEGSEPWCPHHHRVHV